MEDCFDGVDLGGAEAQAAKLRGHLRRDLETPSPLGDAVGDLFRRDAPAAMLLDIIQFKRVSFSPLAALAGARPGLALPDLGQAGVAGGVSNCP